MPSFSDCPPGACAFADEVAGYLCPNFRHCSQAGDPPVTFSDDPWDWEDDPRIDALGDPPPPDEGSCYDEGDADWTPPPRDTWIPPLRRR